MLQCITAQLNSSGRVACVVSEGHSLKLNGRLQRLAKIWWSSRYSFPRAIRRVQLEQFNSSCKYNVWYCVVVINMYSTQRYCILIESEPNLKLKHIIIELNERQMEVEREEWITTTPLSGICTISSRCELAPSAPSFESATPVSHAHRTIPMNI